eukprot:g3622.t1
MTKTFLLFTLLTLAAVAVSSSSPSPSVSPIPVIATAGTISKKPETRVNETMKNDEYIAITTVLGILMGGCVLLYLMLKWKRQKLAREMIGEAEKLENTPAQPLPVYGPPSLMSKKMHGTCNMPVQQPLRWNVDERLADRICCFTRKYAERSGYFRRNVRYVMDVRGKSAVPYFDSVSGLLLFVAPRGLVLFVAPRGRSWHEFWAESTRHGWPSFRDQEVNWAYVRCLPYGECVSVTGTHLGHNIPDRRGENRYCINLVSIAGNPTRYPSVGLPSHTSEESNGQETDGEGKLAASWWIQAGAPTGKIQAAITDMTLSNS